MPLVSFYTQGLYSRKYGHACDFSEKVQNRAKYLKIWAKMYKTKDYRTQQTARIGHQGPLKILENPKFYVLFFFWGGGGIERDQWHEIV